MESAFRQGGRHGAVAGQGFPCGRIWSANRTELYGALTHNTKGVRLTLSGDEINIRSMCAHPGHDHGRDRGAADRNVVCRASIKTSSSLSNWMHALHFLFCQSLWMSTEINRSASIGICRHVRIHMFIASGASIRQCADDSCVIVERSENLSIRIFDCYLLFLWAWIGMH